MSAAGSRARLYLVSLASLGWAVSFGLLASLAPLTLRDAGQSPSCIGLNTSLYYLGVAAASPLVPLLMRRGRACVVAGMLIDAVTTALFPFVSGAVAWHALRFIGGVGTAMSLIPMETMVNRNAPRDHRASDFGFYALCVASGLGAGAAVGVPLFPLSPSLPYLLAGAVTLVATALAWVGVPAVSAVEEKARGAAVAWVSEALCFGTAWVQGFLEGGTFAFLTLYLLARGLSEPFAGLLVGGLFLGVIVAQLPLGHLADRFGLKRSLVVCLAVLLAGLAAVPLSPVGALPGVLFVLGAACGALYPLGLALLGERVPRRALGRANAYYLAANCVGSLCGPLLIGLAVEALGLSALFTLGGVAVAAVLASSLTGKRAAGEEATQRAA
jgi:MFS family permease